MEKEPEETLRGSQPAAAAVRRCHQHHSGGHHRVHRRLRAGVPQRAGAGRSGGPGAAEDERPPERSGHQRGGQGRGARRHLRARFRGPGGRGRARDLQQRAHDRRVEPHGRVEPVHEEGGSNRRAHEVWREGGHRGVLEHGVHGHARHRRKRAGGGHRDGHADRVRDDLCGAPRHGGSEDAAAAQDGRAGQELEHHELRRHRPHQPHWVPPRPQPPVHVPDRRESRRRGHSGGPAHLRDGDACPRGDPHGEAQGDREEAACRGGPGLHECHLRRQDGHADAESTGRDGDLPAQRASEDRRHGRGLPPGGDPDAGECAHHRGAARRPSPPAGGRLSLQQRAAEGRRERRRARRHWAEHGGCHSRRRDEGRHDGPAPPVAENKGGAVQLGEEEDDGLLQDVQQLRRVRGRALHEGRAGLHPREVHPLRVAERRAAEDGRGQHVGDLVDRQGDGLTRAPRPCRGTGRGGQPPGVRRAVGDAGSPQVGRQRGRGGDAEERGAGHHGDRGCLRDGHLHWVGSEDLRWRRLGPSSGEWRRAGGYERGREGAADAGRDHLLPIESAAQAPDRESAADDRPRGGHDRRRRQRLERAEGSGDRRGDGPARHGGGKGSGGHGLAGRQLQHHPPRGGGGQGHLLQHQELPDLPAEHVGGGAEPDQLLHPLRLRESAERDADPVDQHHHGWASGAESRRGARRRDGAEAAAPGPPRADRDQQAAVPRAHDRASGRGRDAARVLDGIRRGSAGHEPGDHDDVHRVRGLRHGERLLLPIRVQAVLAAARLRQPHVLGRRGLQRAGSAGRHLCPVLPANIPDRGAHDGRFALRLQHRVPSAPVRRGAEDHAAEIR
eukprot:scaffold1154_cov310-Pinguiococcus_pyrenoidosus.AAC.41